MPTRHEVPFSFDPVRAYRALRELIDDPDDTAQVFTIVESFSGFAPRRLLERFREDIRGRRLLASRSRILPILADRARLEAMPKGSLAEAYLAFIDREGITAEGLVAACIAGENGSWLKSDDLTYVTDRLRDTHDLWHTVTGYRGDLIGEGSLLAFSLAQTRNPGVALIIVGALLRARDAEFTRMVIEGFQKGRAADWLLTVEWEELLSTPLDRVRRELRITPVAPYEPVRSSTFRDNGAFRPAS